MSYGGNNWQNQQRNNNASNWPRTRNTRYNRNPASGTSNINGQPLKVQGKPVESSQPPEANNGAILVNGIKQGCLTSPIQSPVNAYNRSPIHQRNNVGLPDSTAAIWQADFIPWTKRPNYDLPKTYPQSIATANGSPYAGGPPISSPSPVGSSRGSTYSNPSPPQAVSGGSSPMMSNYFPYDMNGGRRSSAEEMRCNVSRGSPDEVHINLHDIGRASSSQSPVEPSQYDLFGRNLKTRLSDINVREYHRTSRSSESRSSEDLSIEDIIGEFRDSSPEFGTGTKRDSGSSGSTRCNDCTSERPCDNCSDIVHINNLSNAMNRAKSVQDRPMMEELDAAITALEILTLNHTLNMPITNQLTLPTGNQMVSPNRPPNSPNMTRQLSVTNTCPISGQQLAQPTPSDDIPLASSSPLMFLNQHVVPEQKIPYCPVHNQPQSFYCQTCTKIFCHECATQRHLGHVSQHVVDANNCAREQAERVHAECRFGISTIRNDIDKGVMCAQSLDAKARDAIITVRNLTRQLINSVRARGAELVKSIETTRQARHSALQTRDEGLRFGLLRLTETVENLKRSVQASDHHSNPLDLLIAKDMASAQVFHVKSARNTLPPAEAHFVKFQPLDHRVIDTVKKLGTISTDNGHVGDRQMLMRADIPPLAPPMFTPSGRAISGADFIVSITDNRRVFGDNPYSDIGKSIMILGNKGELEDILCRPWGVACDRDGHIVIADRSNNRIQIFLTNGEFIRCFGYYGTGPGQFDRPAGVAVDARRRIVVADKDNHRVQVFTMMGEFLLCFGDRGTAPGLFNYPWDVATNDDCQIVVSDTRNHRIQLFSAEGIFLRRFGFETEPQLWKCFDSPRGVAFNNEGNVIVTDFNNHRILVVDSDFIGARFLGGVSLAAQPLPPKTFLRPQGVAVDDAGHIIVCDSRNYRVQILDANGVCLRRFGTQGAEPDQMDRPSGVAVTPDGRIVVVDFGNNRVLVF